MLSPIRRDPDPLPSIESALPFDLELVRMHCAIDGNQWDSLLLVYLQAAMSWIEDATHRAVFARPHRWVLCDFELAERQEIRLPRGKTQSVASIAYVAGRQTFTLE